MDALSKSLVNEANAFLAAKAAAADLHRRLVAPAPGEIPFTSYTNKDIDPSYIFDNDDEEKIWGKGLIDIVLAASREPATLEMAQDFKPLLIALNGLQRAWESREQGSIITALREVKDVYVSCKNLATRDKVLEDMFEKIQEENDTVYMKPSPIDDVII